MKTGHHLPHEDPYLVHRQAITTGAVRVFMKQLCADMMRLHLFTGDTDMDGILQSCATRLLQMGRLSTCSARASAMGMAMKLRKRSSGLLG